MHPALKVILVVLFEAMAIAFALFFFWLIQQQYIAIEQSSIVEVQSGMGGLLLPLLLPLLHLMGIVEKRFATGYKQAKFRKIQSKLFVLLVLILFGSGLVINQMVMSQLKINGYKACSAGPYQPRFPFTSYSKDSSKCPNS